MLKVLHVITTADRGGAENQLLILVEEQVKSGIDVEVLCLKGSVELESNFSYLGVPLLKQFINKNFVAQVFGFLSLIHKRRYSIIHAHLPRAELVSLLGYVFIPRVVTRHNSEPFYPGAIKWFSSFLSIVSCCMARYTIFITEAVRKFALEHNEILPHCKSTVIHYGIQESKVRKGRIRFRIGKELRVLTIGRLVIQKDILTQVKAIAHLNKKNVYLDIVGDGPQRDALSYEIERRSLTANIRLLGRIKNSKKFMGEYDLFVLSSIYEGFGLVLLEALSQNIPIFCSDIPTSREILGNHFSCFFPPGDYIYLSKLLENYLETGDYINTDYNEILKNFDIAEKAEQLLHVYKSVISRVE
jgi:glycosyltransferase involved in cell wall biosynthesis